MAMRWYIVHAYSNFEAKVAQAIRDKADQDGLGDLIEDVMVPTESVVTMRAGKKYDSSKRFFPGYVLIKMELNDQTIHLVNSISKVNGFLGNAGRPSPIPEKEAMRIIDQVKEGVTSVRSPIRFNIGEQVRVSDGPFAMFNGVVEGVDDTRERVRVAVTIFGRETPVELEFAHVEKV